MKIWQVDPFGLTPYYDRALCHALAQAGHEVRLITSRSLYDRAIPAVDGYQVYELTYGCDTTNFRRLGRLSRAVFYPVRQQQLLRRLEEELPDVVHMQWCRLPAADHWLIRQIQRRGIPVVLTIHDVEPLFAQAFGRHLHRIYAVADRLIVHTQANLNRLLGSQPALGGKTHVIPHPAVAWQEPPVASRGLARQQLNIPLDVPVLLFFGTDRPYKGLDVLLEAVRLARQSCLDVCLIVAGRLEKPHVLVLSEAADPRIMIYPGFVPSDQVWLYHRAADVAVLPYCQVSQSGELITAMGFGLPVIVAAVGGMPETVDGNGWMVPAEDAAALAQAICALSGAREKLAAMGQRSLALIHERHSPERVARQTLALYQEALSR